MKNLFKRCLASKPALALASAVTSVAAFAEGTAEATGVTADLVTAYVDEAKGEIVTVFTAGAVIVGAFFVWGVIKRALNRSK